MAESLQNNPQPRSAKGIQARKKLMRAALVVLERTGYHAMRITDVTQEAGVATGLFYHYFKDLKSLTIEVLSDFVAQSENLASIERNVPRGDWYQRIYAHNAIVVESYAARPGLMRCLFQLADQDPEFGQALRHSYVAQLGWLVQQMPRLFPNASITDAQALIFIYTIAGSAETLLRNYFVTPDPSLQSIKISANELTELLSVVFYRCLFLHNPPPERMRYTQFLLGVSKSDPITK